MHDPMTVAFQIQYPWFKRQPNTAINPDGYRRTFITIWHVDPERSYPGMGSDDNSCDWHGSYRPLDRAEMGIVEGLWDLESVIGNHPIYGSELYPAIQEGKRGPLGEPFEEFRRLIMAWRKRNRRWWQHPRWHVHHWKIQVHPLQDLKRWLWSRCEVCGKRFAWGEAPTSSQWGGDGPRWFHGEKCVRHGLCAGGKRRSRPSTRQKSPSPCHNLLGGGWARACGATC